jgi:hypothetical protein
MVTVDGNVVDPRKTPLHLAKGAHVVLVTAVGYRGARYNLDVAEGEIRALPVNPGSALEAVLPGDNHVETRRVPWMRPTGIAALGVGIASIWVGSLAGLVAIDRRDVQNANCAQGLCNQAGVSAAHDGATWATTSTATFITGAALVALGSVLFVLSFTSKRSSSTASVRFGPGGAWILGQFE